MGNIRAGTLMKFTKLLIANVSPGFLHMRLTYICSVHNCRPLKPESAAHDNDDDIDAESCSSQVAAACVCV